MWINWFIITSILLTGDPEYKKFETDNTAGFRETYAFEYPKFAELPVADENSSEINAKDPVNYMSGGEPELTVDEPDKLSNLIVWHKNVNPSGEMEGYRVQIYAGSNINNANKIKTTFIQRYPDVSVYTVYEQPTFRVRTGDFVNRKEAQFFSNTIKQDFPGAFVVPDKIKVRKSKKDWEPENNDVEPNEIQD